MDIPCAAHYGPLIEDAEQAYDYARGKVDSLDEQIADLQSERDNSELVEIVREKALRSLFGEQSDQIAEHAHRACGCQFRPPPIPTTTVAGGQVQYWGDWPDDIRQAIDDLAAALNDRAPELVQHLKALAEVMRHVGLDPEFLCDYGTRA